jgi:hypothetical protein
VSFLRQVVTDGVTERYYQGIRGNLAIIDMDDDVITHVTGCMHLINLGLSHLIPSIFPDSAETFGLKKGGEQPPN